ncbi:SHOCT domain-containing protein [Vannielia litorea]|uniref:Short C-terminal domain-containing protein n=1 Tax=Vannielia litorea TaxID=1217970 RepID=A0A1N6GR68_9RHOB|nr:SHOCT domain-containing protein [Vannielia litorea]SIO10041.1 Short C-terminal domain-containing protein [Vannielia litorea]
MARLTPEGKELVAEIAQRHGVTTGAVEHLLMALAAGHGTQAQFNHPDLGGMGQWSMGGMTMVGDMFNNALKARVDALCSELSQAMAERQVLAHEPRPASHQSQSQGSGTSLFVAGSGFDGSWWPEDLGAPSSTGAQNDMRYAVFPATRRLAISVAGRVEVFDTADHHIGGVSQQQSGDQSLTFTSQHGLVKIADLKRVATEEPGEAPVAEDAGTTEDAKGDAPEPPAMAAPPMPSATSTPAAAPAPAAAGAASPSADEIISLIRKLAELREGGILTDAEFEAKKAELLGRL